MYDEVIYDALLNDHTRHGIFKRAFADLVNDKLVLDVGTGPVALLATQCVQAGARHVYAVELSRAAADKARSHVHRLGLEKRISVIHDDIRFVRLPTGVDVIVSELVESISGAEGAAVLLNEARRFLTPGGQFIPKRSVTRIAAATLPQAIATPPRFQHVASYYAAQVTRHLGHNSVSRLCIRNLPISNIISSSAAFDVLEFSQHCPIEAHNRIRLVVHSDGKVAGFALWLELEIVNGQTLDTLREKTAWMPAFFQFSGHRSRFVRVM